MSMTPVPLRAKSEILPRYERPLAFTKTTNIHSVEFTIKMYTIIITLNSSQS